MHWTYFVGKYKILNCKTTNNNNLPNITNGPFNLGRLNRNIFGRFFNRRNNFFLINERFKKSDWTKFGINQIDQNKKQNGSINIISNFKNFSIKKKNTKPIYLNKINKNQISLNRNPSNQK